MPIVEEGELWHYGIKRKSGRYPWGSGQTPEERGASFRGQLAELRKQGLTDAQVAQGLGLKNTTELRATISIASNIERAANIARAQQLKAKGMSNGAIAEAMLGDRRKESTIRGYLAPGAKDKADVLSSTSDMIRARIENEVAKGGLGFVDVGKGVSNQLGVSDVRLGTAVKMLESEGYTLHRVPVPQLGTGHDTNTKVLCPPGTKWSDVMQNRDKLVSLNESTRDQGRSWDDIQEPLSFSSKRLQVVYKEDGGDKSDGVMYVRPGAKDLDMGGTKYAQVRVMVDGTHYLKGMAVQKDDLPPGVDIQFHTNKSRGTPVLGPKDNSVLKPVKRLPDGSIDKDNPFGSTINRQMFDLHGKNKSAINIVNEETSWDDWSRNLASQMLSKQRPELVKNQLDVTYERKKSQLDEIMSLTNPTVRERLLRSYADDMDASSVHLKAAAMPRQKTHVILPMNSMKPNEIYAPNYRNGERVVLIRYPHGGKFEIPELTVNNENRVAKKLLGDVGAAVGIHHEVAKRLSGADFDGDTVVVIPNNKRRISTQPPLEKLKEFDPQHEYPGYPGMKKMSNTQTEMGKISNLITDMTIRGATDGELAMAVRHSMVVIDAEKHGLNYKQSAIDHGIAGLRKKYQVTPDRPQGGARTLISRTTGDIKVPDFKLRPQSEGGPIDPKTGHPVYVLTNKTRPKRVVDKVTGEVTWEKVPAEKEVRRGAFDVTPDGHVVPRVDAHSLILGDGTPVERHYADYSNKVKDLANTARLEVLKTKPLEYSPSAKEAYSKEVSSLNTKLNEALKHSPLERQSQVIARSIVKMKRDANPEMDEDTLRKEQSRALKVARARTGADQKARVDITDNEWAAIQAGAIRHSRLKEILDKADIDQVRKLATPRTTATISSGALSRARALANAGYTQAEIADELGVSVSTLRRGLTG